MVARSFALDFASFRSFFTVQLSIERTAGSINYYRGLDN